MHTPLSPDEAEFMLASVTARAKSFDPIGDFIPDKIPGLIKFNGIVKNGKFSISKRVTYPQNFLPRVDGVFREVDPGTCIELTYRLFPSTVMLFFVGGILSLGLGIYFCFFSEKLGYGIGAFCFFVLNYVVCIGNFRIHHRDVRSDLEKVFEL